MGRSFWNWAVKILLPFSNTFMIGMRLYKTIQGCRNEPTTQEILADLSWVMIVSQKAATLAISNQLQVKAQRCQSVERHKLQALPCLSSHLILNGALRKMHFTVVLNPANRSGKPVLLSMDNVGNNLGLFPFNDIRNLALKLYKLAPKSLGDPG